MLSARRPSRSTPEGDFLGFLTASANLPFSVALALMLILAAVELGGALIGAGVSELFDGLTHGHVDLHADLDAHELSFADHLLGWLQLGRVPLLVWLTVFLAAFGLAGLALQSIVDGAIGHLLPALPASLATLVVALPLTRSTARALARILPRDETTAISQDALVGKSAVIVVGTATRGCPAQARATDRHGQVHYFMVEPAEADASFAAGEAVFVIARIGATYRAISPLHPSLN